MATRAEGVQQVLARTIRKAESTAAQQAAYARRLRAFDPTDFATIEALRQDGLRPAMLAAISEVTKS